MNRILATIIFSPLLAAACADKPACAYKSLCDSQADAAATGLFEALDRCASRGVMLGHQDDLSYGVGWVDAGDGRSDVRDVTGDYPSLFGWDLGHLELDSLRNLDGVPFDAMRRNMLSVDRMGGVNALSWPSAQPAHGRRCVGRVVGRSRIVDHLRRGAARPVYGLDRPSGRLPS